MRCSVRLHLHRRRVACRSRDRAGRYSADGYFYKATVLKALYPGDLEYDVPYQTYAEKAG